MPETDGLLQSLNADISRLNRELDSARAEAKRYRLSRKEVIAQRDELQQQVQSLTADRDRFKAAAEAAPGDLARQVAELQSQLRQRDFRDAFTAEAIKAGVRPEAVSDLFTLSGLAPPPEGEEGKADVFAEFLGASKTTRSWAFGDGASGATSSEGHSGTQPPGEATNTLRLVPTSEPPGAGRAMPGNGASQVRYTRGDVSQPGWQKARPDLVTALSEGRAVMVEG